jgi:hypothetical protein
MGLLNLFGNAIAADSAKVQDELEDVLAPGETVGAAFRVSGELFVFTGQRLIFFEKQGLTNSKVTCHSILFRSITQFAVESAGTLHTVNHLKIWLAGSADPIVKQLSGDGEMAVIHKHLASGVFGRPTTGD